MKKKVFISIFFKKKDGKFDPKPSIAFICFCRKWSTAWKVSKYGVISCPYFPVFGPEIIPYLDNFHGVYLIWNILGLL